MPRPIPPLSNHPSLQASRASRENDNDQPAGPRRHEDTMAAAAAALAARLSKSRTSGAAVAAAGAASLSYALSSSHREQQSQYQQHQPTHALAAHATGQPSTEQLAAKLVSLSYPTTALETPVPTMAGQEPPPTTGGKGLYPQSRHPNDESSVAAALREAGEQGNTTANSTKTDREPMTSRKMGRSKSSTMRTTKKQKSKRRRQSSSSTIAEERTRRRDSSSLPPRLSKRAKLILASDEHPERLTNPLLELPSVVNRSSATFATATNSGSTSKKQPPQASELFLASHLSHCPADTFPLSYYARVLGFEVPVPSMLNKHSNNQDDFVALEPAEVPLMSREKDAAYQIPPLGKWWRQQQCQDNKLDFVDPVYVTLQQTGRKFDWAGASKWDPITESRRGGTTKEYHKKGEESTWSMACCEMAREMGFLRESDSIDRTTSPSHTFVLSLSRARIQYRFVWFPLPDDGAERAEMDRTYGMPSAALTLRKQQSELMLFVESYTLRLGDERTAPLDESSRSIEKRHAIVLLALVLERARAHDVLYGWVCGVSGVLEDVCTRHFRMMLMPSEDGTAFVCDLQRCSYRYAYLLKPAITTAPVSTLKDDSLSERWLVRLKSEAQDALEKSEVTSAPAKADSRRTMSCLPCTGGVADSMHNVEFGVQIDQSNLSMNFIDGQGNTQRPVDSSTFVRQAKWDILRSFPLFAQTSDSSEKEDEILGELRRKQDSLAMAESVLEPTVRSMLQKLVDIRLQYEDGTEQRIAERKILQDYEAVLDRRKEMDMAWQRQLEQDMDAVCDICNDGEVTPDNQILFCEACNVAVHQYCYGIERIPEGDYYCIPCRYFKRKKMGETTSRKMERGSSGSRMVPAALPICCELCPRKQGAFIRTEMVRRERRKDRSSEGRISTESPIVTKWVHVTCAKWQGLNIVKEDTVEDPAQLKIHFLRQNSQCIICLGSRGAYNKCRMQDCPHVMHVSCARSTGLCEVVHGENCHGPVEIQPWTLACPEHSELAPDSIDRDKRIPIDQLVRLAREFPPEPKPPPLPQRPDKVFFKMNGKERRKFLADREFENALLHELLNNKLNGVHCEVCHIYEEDGKNLTRCLSCRAVFCDACQVEGDGDTRGRDFKCSACRFVADEKKKGIVCAPPCCDLCVQPGGCLRPGHASPVNNRTKWKHNSKLFAKTYFAKPIWCHTLCAFWHRTKLRFEADGTVDCTNVVMSNGLGFVRPSTRCALCGHHHGLKLECNHTRCRAWGEVKTPYFFHPTCARQAGLEVADIMTPDVSFHVKCLQHSGNAFNLRARLEDLIEVEKRRAGEHLERAGLTMSLAHAARLMNKAIVVMQQIGWAWRWAEWWVEYGDNWEPLLEEDEKEENLTKEELRIVDSTRESRCEDARRCRLTALSAALRNRMYDNAEEDGLDTLVLGRALRSMLHAKSLVGPLEKHEIDFYVEWLSRAYRSKSRLLGFGAEKARIKEDAPANLHSVDGSPKFMLLSRRLPGLHALAEDVMFESDVNDVDDFLRPETLEDGTPVTEELLEKHKKGRRSGCSPKKSPVGTRRTERQSVESSLRLPGQEELETPVPAEAKPDRSTQVASQTGMSVPMESGKVSRKKPGRKPKQPRDPSEEHSEMEDPKWQPRGETNAVAPKTTTTMPVMSSSRGGALGGASSSQNPSGGIQLGRPSGKSGSSGDMGLSILETVGQPVDTRVETKETVAKETSQLGKRPRTISSGQAGLRREEDQDDPPIESAATQAHSTAALEPLSKTRRGRAPHKTKGATQEAVVPDIENSLTVKSSPIDDDGAPCGLEETVSKPPAKKRRGRSHHKGGDANNGNKSSLESDGTSIDALQAAKEIPAVQHANEEPVSKRRGRSTRTMAGDLDTAAPAACAAQETMAGEEEPSVGSTAHAQKRRSTRKSVPCIETETAP